MSPAPDPQKPFWTLGLEPIRSDPVEPDETFDTVIVGAGYGGLNAAIELATHGMKVLVVEARSIGEGASSKAAGALANSLKARLHDLTRLYGEDSAKSAYREAVEARVFTEGLIAELGLECDLRRSDRLVGAHSERSFARLRRELPAMQRELPATRLLSANEFGSFMQAPGYRGGMLVPQAATINPAKYQFGLARHAQKLGVKLLQRSRMIEVVQDGAGASVAIEGLGKVRAAHVYLATNAEAGSFSADPLLRTLANSIVPVPAFVVVSKPLSPAMRDGVIKGASIFGDTRKVLNYLAVSTDGTRLIYSSRAGFLEGSTEHKASRIVADYERRFPGLAGLGMEYFWTGRFAITQDLIPHNGAIGAIHWTVGCCGTGITMSSYLGRKVARRILRGNDADTIFDLPLPPVAAWRRNPILFGAAIQAYRVYDKYMN
jgi:glycine/D-amino acid oxidase-like deaminating enzyme